MLKFTFAVLLIGVVAWLVLITLWLSDVRYKGKSKGPSSYLTFSQSALTSFSTNTGYVMNNGGSAALAPQPIIPSSAAWLSAFNYGAFVTDAPGFINGLQCTLAPLAAVAVAQTGTVFHCQLWKSPACNGAWEPTALVASQPIPAGVTGGYCFSNKVDCVPTEAGDRFATVFYVATVGAPTVGAGTVSYLDVDNTYFGVGMTYTRKCPIACCPSTCTCDDKNSCSSSSSSSSCGCR